MKVYVETNDLREAEKLGRLPYISGLCINPERMKRYGSGEANDYLSRFFEDDVELLIDLNGDSWEAWIEEGIKLASMGLPLEKLIFRFPVTEGAMHACAEFKRRGMKSCVRFINNIHQAFLSMQSGADVISIPCMEMGDKGSMPFDLVAELQKIISTYGYSCEIMLTQVADGLRFTEALKSGVTSVSVPSSLIYGLQQNLLDNESTAAYVRESRLHSLKVSDVMRSAHTSISDDSSILEATAAMTLGGLGAVAVLDSKGNLMGVFTDGDLRRQLQSRGIDFLKLKMSDLSYKNPVTIEENASLTEASAIFREKRIDNILVTRNQVFAGIIDIQDLNL
jgi:CBS domain-containing protein